ncbi:hypothetical protein A8709_26440 [Paenibacillus pectinilyticus]|uniref:DUF4393 domain-containing protein n=1 Tax=Paenibacillus pectinilyticus TaxID=512399 RepID=A0A1C1A263_9BACL|nr:hypothetical protein A8709_26440 [Paenibacillus pectinilyticus]
MAQYFVNFAKKTLTEIPKKRKIRMHDKIKESLIGILKASLSNVPYAGGLLNELIFDIRGRIVQKRINNFVESFLNYILDHGINLEESAFTSETFNDLYISILKRVIDITSEEKLRIFRQILVSNTIMSYESTFRETFLDLVSRLDYIQIEILKMYKETGRRGSMDLEDGYIGSVSQLTSRSFKIETIETIKTHFPNINTIETEGKYEFYMCDLISKSLLVDKKTMGNTWNVVEKEGLTLLYITDFGKEFINFITSTP